MGLLLTPGTWAGNALTRHGWDRHLARKSARVGAGRHVRLRCQLHRPGRPDRVVWRGAMVRSGPLLRWRPFLRRWRTVDLTTAVHLSTFELSPGRSGLALAGTQHASYLRVDARAAGVAAAMLTTPARRPARG